MSSILVIKLLLSIMILIVCFPQFCWNFTVRFVAVILYVMLQIRSEFLFQQIHTQYYLAKGKETNIPLTTNHGRKFSCRESTVSQSRFLRFPNPRQLGRRFFDGHTDRLFPNWESHPLYIFEIADRYGDYKRTPLSQSPRPDPHRMHVSPIHLHDVAE